MLTHGTNGSRASGVSALAGGTGAPPQFSAASVAPAREVAVVVDLSQPLPGHDREHFSVELRKPTFGDWLECGDIHETVIHDPKAMQLGGAGSVQVKINHEALAKWFARLSGLPIASLVKLTMPDARKVLKEVVALVGSIDAGN